MTLTADNDYSGATYIRDGVLKVLGWHSGGGLYEVGGGMAGTTPVLAGTGTILGEVRVWSDGELSPGLSIGTLSIQGDVTLGGTLAIELEGTGGGAADLLEVAGTLDLTGSSLRLAVLSDLDDDAYVFVTYGILRGGPFGKVLNLPAGYHLDYNYQGLNQIALVIPEPAPTKLLAAVLLVLWVARSRRR